MRPSRTKPSFMVFSSSSSCAGGGRKIRAPGSLQQAPLAENGSMLPPRAQRGQRLLSSTVFHRRNASASDAEKTAVRPQLSHVICVPDSGGGEEGAGVVSRGDMPPSLWARL